MKFRYLLRTFVVFAGFASVLCGNVYAEWDMTHKDTFLVGQIGVTSGGDKLVEVQYTNGETEDIKAGGGVFLSGGFLLKTFPALSRNHETQVTIGYYFDDSEAENGDVSWSRIPLEVMQFYRLKRFRVGGGLTYHINPTLEGSGFANNVDADFDNALGLVAEADFLFGKGGFIALKYTKIDYEVYGIKVNGDNVGLTLGALF